MQSDSVTNTYPILKIGTVNNDKKDTIIININPSKKAVISIYHVSNAKIENLRQPSVTNTQNPKPKIIHVVC